MEIKNLTGLEKPLEKLVQVIAEGIGGTANIIFEFDAKKLRRIGEAEAEAEKVKIIKKAEGSAKALEVLGRAGKRFALEQYNKQINLENIIVGTKEMLKDEEVSDKPVDKDWAFRFMNIAQDVSREDMQELLSKILAEGIKKPTTFSLRTLDFVKNLSKNDLILFRKFALISTSDEHIFVTQKNTNNGFSAISYSEIMKIIEIGLIQPSTKTVMKYGNIKKGKILKFGTKIGEILKFEAQEDQDEFNLPILHFSLTRKEISSIIEIEPSDKKFVNNYQEQLKIFLKSKKFRFL